MNSNLEGLGGFVFSYILHAAGAVNGRESACDLRWKGGKPSRHPIS